MLAAYLISIFVFWVTLSILPLAAIEAWWIARATSIRLKKLALPVFYANLVSALFRVPLVLLILLILKLSFDSGQVSDSSILSLVTLQTPWLFPHLANFYWQFPLATLALLPVFFAISTGVESLLLRRLFRERAIAHGTRAVWTANTLTFILTIPFWVYQYLSVPHA